MSREYWDQFDPSELNAMHGIEQDLDTDLDQDEDDTMLNQVECHRCSDTGCNYCLCVGY